MSRSRPSCLNSRHRNSRKRPIFCEVLAITTNGELVDTGGTAGAGYETGGNFLVSSNGEVWAITSNGVFLDTGGSAGSGSQFGGNFIVKNNGDLVTVSASGQLSNTGTNVGTSFQFGVGGF